MDVPTLLLSSTSLDPSISVPARQQLEALVHSNPSDLLSHLSLLSADVSVPEPIRLAASSLLCDSISSSSSAALWAGLSSLAKSGIKTYEMWNLGSHVEALSKAAIKTISAVAHIELPRREWDSLIGTLCENFVRDNERLRLASMEVLSDVLENGVLKPTVIAKLLYTLTGILAGKEATEGDRVAGLTAVASIVRFYNRDCSPELSLETIVGVVAENCCGKGTVSVKLAALECLLEIVKRHYGFFGEFTQVQIQTATLSCMGNFAEENSTAMQALKVWGAIAAYSCSQDLLKPSRNSRTSLWCIYDCYQKLCPILLEFLKLRPESDLIYTCLKHVADVVWEPILPPLLAYFLENVKAKDWRCRAAAAAALGCLVDVPLKTIDDREFQWILDSLIELLQDCYKTVRVNTVRTLALATGLRLPSLNSAASLQKLVSGSLLALKDSQSKVSGYACEVFSNLADWLKPGAGAGSPLTPYFRDIAYALWANALREDLYTNEESVSDKSQDALKKVISCLATEAEVQTDVLLMISNIMENFDKTLIPQLCKNEKVQMYQDYICDAIRYVFDVPEVKIPVPLVKHMFDSILESFKVGDEINEAGRCALEWIMGTLSCRDTPRQALQLYKYLMPIFNSGIDDMNALSEATNCFCDIIKFFGPEGAHFISKTITMFRHQVCNPEINSNLLFQILNTLSAISADAASAYIDSLEDVLEILKVARTTSLDPVKGVQLRGIVIFNYILIMTAGQQCDNPVSIFYPHIPEVFDYLEIVCGEEATQMAYDTIRNIAFLIVQFAVFYDKQLKPLLSRPFVTRIFAEFEKRVLPADAGAANLMRIELTEVLSDVMI